MTSCCICQNIQLNTASRLVCFPSDKLHITTGLVDDVIMVIKWVIMHTTRHKHAGKYHNKLIKILVVLMYGFGKKMPFCDNEML